MHKDHHHDLHLHHYYMAIKIFNLCYTLYNLWWYTLRFQTGFLTAKLSIKIHTHILYFEGKYLHENYDDNVAQFLECVLHFLARQLKSIPSTLDSFHRWSSRSSSSALVAACGHHNPSHWLLLRLATLLYSTSLFFLDRTTSVIHQMMYVNNV